jgi:hypothetical protein
MQHLQLVKDDYRHHDILQQFYDDLPSKPYCSDTKCLSLVRPKATASKQPYIQANHPSLIKWLFIDIDSDLKHEKLVSYFDENLLFRFHDRNLPQPQIIMRNRNNGHVQYAYKLKDPVSLFENSRQAPVKYLKALQYALTLQLGGDLSFGGSLAKNPLDTQTWDIFITGAEPYTLADLHGWLDLDDPINQPPKRPKNASNDEYVSPFAGLGRNCDTFDYLRFIAYPIASGMTQTALFNHLLALGLEFNSRFEQPLLHNELKCIARSIAKFCNSPRFGEHSERFIEYQRESGRKGAIVANANGACSLGGKARSDKYASMRVTAHEMRESGLSNTEIASKLGVARLTVIRWFK